MFCFRQITHTYDLSETMSFATIIIKILNFKWENNRDTDFFKTILEGSKAKQLDNWWGVAEGIH